MEGREDEDFIEDNVKKEMYHETAVAKVRRRTCGIIFIIHSHTFLTFPVLSIL